MRRLTDRLILAWLVFHSNPVTFTWTPGTLTIQFGPGTDQLRLTRRARKAAGL